MFDRTPALRHHLTMRKIVWLTCLVACGGGSKKQVEEAPPPVVEKKVEAPAPPPEPEPPPVPKSYSAKAAMTAVKGAKIEGGTVTFMQEEGSDTKVSSDFSGLKKGTYHLVIHDGSECGPNATKAGAPWKGGEAVKLMFKVGGDNPGNIDESGVKLMLNGVAPIIGQTLVLHDDKKGTPGKALACGTIDAVGGGD
jgi:Cu/Zn superoxide dismutase